MIAMCLTKLKYKSIYDYGGCFQADVSNLAFILIGGRVISMVLEAVNCLYCCKFWLIYT